MPKLKKKKAGKKKKRARKNRKKNRMEPPLPKYSFGRNIPVQDFFEDHDLKTEWGISESLNNLIFAISKGEFLLWDAVIREEQGLPISGRQEEALDELLNFSDDDDDLILYIDGIARPTEPWYDTINKVVPKLILEPLTTDGIHDEMYHEMWPRVVECLEDHAQNLPLPHGVRRPIDVIPDKIRHRLWLQYCLDALSGLGQDEELTLENEDQNSWRVDIFLDVLKKCKDSVEYYDLTIEKLFELIKLPPRDEKIMVESMLERLGLESVTEKIHESLG